MDLNKNPVTTHWVSSVDSPEFTHFTHSISLSSVIALDAEWKPLLRGSHNQSFPTVALLQVACQLSTNPQSTPVFLLDLLSIPLLEHVYEVLRRAFVCRNVLKLGFGFKQDLAYLSSTFCERGCGDGLDRVEPFLDITSIHTYLQKKDPGRRNTKQTKSLATICEEVLGISISKDLQCSDWSVRPLTEEQKAYAAADAHCLLEIFNVFQIKVINKENWFHDLGQSHVELGLKGILVEPNTCQNILRNKVCGALDILRADAISEFSLRLHSTIREVSTGPSMNVVPMDSSILQIVRKYGDKIILKESERKPKTSKKKAKRKTSGGLICKEKRLDYIDSWQGPPPWDMSLGGDGSPRFLCDVMVEGLAKHLRCVGVDAAVPYSKKPETRELIHQAQREKRVLLTRDAKLLRHDYLIRNQIYRVKSLLKNEQLLEVIATFELRISEDQLMTRCTKCNGKFIQKPLTTEEAVEAAKGFQVIPNCLFDKKLEFWQCMECNQLYWEGTQYHNAVQKFIDVCKLQTST